MDASAKGGFATITEEDYVRITMEQFQFTKRQKRWLLISVALAVLLFGMVLLSGSASATTYNWDGGDGANQLASDADNWAPDGVPITGDVITVDGTNDEAITWDLGAGVVIASYDQQAGYSGTVTTTSIFNCSGAFHLHGGTFVEGAFDVYYGSFLQDGGTFTGAGGLTNWVHLLGGGAWTKTAGTMTTNKLCLDIVGASTIASNSIDFVYRLNVAVTASVTLGTHWYQSASGGSTCVIAGPLNVGAYYFSIYRPEGATISAMVTGSGALRFYPQSTCIGPSFSTVMAVPIIFQQQNFGGSSFVESLASDVVTSSTITISSADPTYVLTLNLAGYQLSATTITASTRGIISSSVAGAKLTASGAITVSANGQINATNIAYIDCKSFDPSAGTWVPDNCQVNMTTAYGTLKLGAAQTLYDLQMVNNTNVTGAASVTHLIKYSGMGVSQLYHWLNATVTIGNYSSNASGLIDIPARTLGIGNLYRMQVYFIWAPSMTNSPGVTGIIGTLYTFTPTWNESVTSVTLYLKPSWASYGGGAVSGTPIKLVGPGPHQFQLNATSANGTLVGHWFWNVSTPWAAVFIGSPILNIANGSTYTYSITLDETANVTALILPSWLTLSNNGTNGTPWVLNGLAVHGTHTVSIRAISEDGTGVSYLNFTISAWVPSIQPPLTVEQMFLIVVFLSLAFLFTVLFYRDEKIGLLTGILWIVTGLVALVMLSNVLTLITIIPGIYYIIGGIES